MPCVTITRPDGVFLAKTLDHTECEACCFRGTAANERDCSAPADFPGCVGFNMEGVKASVYFERVTENSVGTVP